MSVIEFNGIKFDLNFENANDYYKDIKADSSQACRNFIEYSKQMSEVELAFFKLFDVDITKIEYSPCNLTIAERLRKTCTIQGEFYCFGELVDEENIDDECSEVQVGNLKVELPVSWEPSDDMPNGCLYFYFTCNIPWLLDEKCEFDLYTPVLDEIKFALTSPYRHIRGAIQTSADAKKYKVYIENYFAENDIEFSLMSKKEIRAYKKEWISNYINSQADFKEACKVCIDGKHGNYLWYLFSYELSTDSVIEGVEETRNLFLQADRNECVFVNHDYNGQFCYKLKNADKINPQDIEDGDKDGGIIDVVITADDFSWTYAFNHERGWIGPYFSEKK